MDLPSVDLAKFDTLDKRVDYSLWRLNEWFLREITDARHLTDDTALDVPYYIRHRIETIKRIRLTARTDALALASMIDEDYDAARVWARYACEELGHDQMFYADLERHGVSRAAVDATAMLPSTKRLGEFLFQQIDEQGALPAVAYSVFVEWNSDRFSGPAVEKARLAFGEAEIQGAARHLMIDENLGHAQDMLWLVKKLTRNDDGEERVFALIDQIARLFREYFSELSAYRRSSRTA